VESFNGKLRGECLNEHWFDSVGHAREIVEKWRIDYNEVRPHYSLNQKTPSEYADEVAASPLGARERTKPLTNQPMTNTNQPKEALTNGGNKTGSRSRVLSVQEW
jgi:putative transposase